MIPEAIVVAVIIGVFTGGSIWKLTEPPIKHKWLLFGSFGLLVVSYPLMRLGVIPEGASIHGVTHVIGFISIVAAAVINRRIPGAWLVALGVMMNIVAITANGGMMPASKTQLVKVFGEETTARMIELPRIRNGVMTADSKLKFLCDIVPAKRPYVLIPSVCSPGDLVLTAGFAIAIVWIMRRPDDKPVPEEEPSEEKSCASVE